MNNINFKSLRTVNIITLSDLLFKGYFVCILFCAFVCPHSVFAQEKQYIDFVETFNNSISYDEMSLPVVNKKDRLRNNSSISFKLEYASNVPDSVVKCLEVASDIWRSCLNMNSNYQIRLELLWEELPADEDVKISVAYFPDSLRVNYTPASLYYSLKNYLSHDGSPDAKISINKNKQWDCGYNVENNVGVRNLNYAMLRSIAVALGFGSSLSVRNFSTGDVVRFPFSDGHSLFDNMLVADNGVRLKELYNTGRTQNPDILKFCTGALGDVYIDNVNYHNVKDSSSIYKMYTPPIYEKNKSLIYLDNKQSLMHYSLDVAIKKFQIDTVTVNILNKMGWNVNVSDMDFKIIGNNIPESGIASAYAPHSFYIEGEGKNNICNAEWSFYLSSINGNDILEKSSEGSLFFDIDAISDANNYKINVNGDIYGKIVFTGMVNGKQINLQYNLTLGLKPSITNVSFVKQNNDGFDSYNVACKVDYRGADYLYVTLEEEYGSTLRSQFVREPYLAHFVCKNITSPYYAWIDIVVENDYGRDVHTIELPPYSNQRSPSGISNSVHGKIQNNDYSEIRVFNVYGQYLKTIKDYFEIQSLIPGMYILEFSKDNMTVRTSKLLVK